MNVNAGAKLPLIGLNLDATAQARLDRNRVLIARLARVSELSDASEAPKGAVTLPVEGGAFCLPLADVVDVAAEKARLDKAMGKLDKEMGGIAKKLDNPKFTANAPEEVVAENRARLEAGQDERAKLDAALARLAEL